MKTAIYFDGNDAQIVLTSENDWEKSVLKAFENSKASVFRGSFYEANGGYFRQGRNDESLMIRLNKETP